LCKINIEAENNYYPAFLPPEAGKLKRNPESRPGQDPQKFKAGKLKPFFSLKRKEAKVQGWKRIAKIICMYFS